jgi:hypothetical protein
MEEKICWGKVTSNPSTPIEGSFFVLDKQYLTDRKIIFYNFSYAITLCHMQLKNNYIWHFIDMTWLVAKDKLQKIVVFF